MGYGVIDVSPIWIYLERGAIFFSTTELCIHPFRRMKNKFDPISDGATMGAVILAVKIN